MVLALTCTHVLVFPLAAMMVPKAACPPPRTTRTHHQRRPRQRRTGGSSWKCKAPGGTLQHTSLAPAVLCPQGVSAVLSAACACVCVVGHQAHRTRPCANTVMHGVSSTLLGETRHLHRTRSDRRHAQGLCRQAPGKYQWARATLFNPVLWQPCATAPLPPSPTCDSYGWHTCTHGIRLLVV